MIHIFAHVVQLNSIQLKIGQFDTVPIQFSTMGHVR